MKYKLLKEFPGYPVGYEFEDGTYPIFDAFNKKAYPDFFEPIVEKKTYDDLKICDRAYFIQNGNVYEDAWQGECRSETFLTREEAEDENKRREWACRKDKFIPKKCEIFYFPNPDGYVYSLEYIDNYETIFINLGLAFRTREDCQDAIDNHDLIRLFYQIR